ncbi:hypothetical protein K8R61_03195 [bacterium]|nr:hypothetical protein [bacterium]
MYVYIYDEVVKKRKYSKLLINIEKKITDLGLNGKIIRLEGIKNVEKIIQNEIKYGAKTVIAVGIDKTINQTINAVIKLNQNKELKEIPIIGTIPIENKENLIAKAMGISSYKDACNAILARRLKILRLAKINELFFVSQINLLGNYNIIDIEKDYRIEIKKPCDINIINIPLSKELGGKIAINSKKNDLKLLIIPKKSKKGDPLKNQSIFSLKKLTISKNTKKILIDNSLEVTAPAFIKTTDKKIVFIVGKNRVF